MKIIIFSAHPAVWQFSLNEAILASELQKHGHEVLYISPGESFSDCTICLSAHNLYFPTNWLIRRLIKQSALINNYLVKKNFSLKGYSIDKIISPEDRKKIDEILAGINKNNFQDLTIDGMPIGKMSAYDSLLIHKKMSINFNNGEWLEYIATLKNTLISLFACRSIINNEQPDRIIVFNTLYAVNHVWKKYSESKSIPAYFMCGGLNISDINNSILVAKGDTGDFFNSLKNVWPQFRNLPISKKMLIYVTNHFLEILKGRDYQVYSAKKSEYYIDIRNKFKINDKQKILTATMSSYDEIFAAEYAEGRSIQKDLLFASQIDWITALIKYIENRKDLCLIIRVHPREFPNKRDHFKSEHAKKLEDILINLPSNVKVNWPLDNISIYDLAQETEVFLNGWSTIGTEMSLLGIPVVVYSKNLINYPADLNYSAETYEDYFNKIELALKDGWEYKKIKYVFRWLALCYYRTVVRLSDGDNYEPSDDHLSQNIFHRIYGALPKSSLKSIIKLIFLSNGKKQAEECHKQINNKIKSDKMLRMIIENKESLASIQDPREEKISEEDEEIMIRVELERLYKALYSRQTNNLRDSQDNLQTKLKRYLDN